MTHLPRLALLSLSCAAALSTGCRDRVIAVPVSSAGGVAGLMEAPRQPGTMTVTGTAKLDVAPDCADLTITLSADNLHTAIATRAVTDKEHGLVTALKKLGLANADIRLSELTLDPVFVTRGMGGSRVLSTYHASITVTATTRDFAKVGAIMEAGSIAGATSMSSQFRRSDLAAMKKKVRDMALKAAREKAAQTATALDIKLGPVVSVSETPDGYMWGRSYFPQANVVATQPGDDVLGGTLQSLSLTVTVGYELPRST